MVKKNTTLSVDHQIKEKAQKIIKQEMGLSLSTWFEQALRKLISNYEKEVNL